MELNHFECEFCKESFPYHVEKELHKLSCLTIHDMGIIELQDEFLEEIIESMLIVILEFMWYRGELPEEGNVKHNLKILLKDSGFYHFFCEGLELQAEKERQSNGLCDLGEETD